jgi:hypothetical protein
LKTIFAFGIVACALLGCTTTSEVVPMGKDSYMVNSDSWTSVSPGQLAIKTSKVANDYCEKQGKHMIVRRMDSAGTPWVTTLTTSFIFSCVGENDPEYARPDLKRDPTTIIEDQRK